MPLSARLKRQASKRRRPKTLKVGMHSGSTPVKGYTTRSGKRVKGYTRG